ncbi:hypothetical protein SAMN05216197_16910 [Pseudomonas graminis]|uniref:Uncharacterized protein n=1 Tax=Pseudomonas graminis TaxID=158627 RepID=A0A1I0JPA3_9PSED|nr:hypothetical protein SAMN05216197_16910 [Pseudomonas graminis]
MTPEQLRTLAAQLISKVDAQSRKIHRDETIIEQLSPAQGGLLDDLLNTDLEAIETELKAFSGPRPRPGRITLATQACAVVTAVPTHCVHHEPDNTQCTCGCVHRR